jgi:hypothetical protein
VPYRVYESEEQAHGRIDERSYYLCPVPQDFAPAAGWPQVKALGYAMRWTVLVQPDLEEWPCRVSE